MQPNVSRAIHYRTRQRIVSVDNQFVVTKKQLKSLNLFCYGFILYTVSFVASTINTVVSPPVCQAFEGLGLVMLISGAVSLMKWKFDNKYLEIIFSVYVIYLMTIVARITKYDYNSLKIIFLDMNFGVLTYFAPFVILLPRNIGFYKKIISIPLVLGVVALLYTISFFKILHNSDWLNRESLSYTETLFFCLCIPMGFVLITYIYYSKRIRWFALTVLTVSLYFLIYRARRGSMFMCVTTMAGAGMIYLIYTKRWALVITSSVFIILVSSVFASNIKLPSTFDFLMSRKDEDTRSPVENDFKADMKPMDWAIGKGIDGTYYSTSVVDDINDLTFQRKYIETGYLQMILKGGIVSLCLLGLVLIPGVLLALFKSSNMLAKAAGIYVLLWMVYTYPTIVNGFHIYYVLVWISVGICYSPKLRNLSDNTIEKYLHD